MKRLAPLLPLTALAVALGLTACGKGGSPASAEGGALVVRIGSSAPLTGSQAHLGKDNENAVRLAIEDLNAAHLKIGGRDASFELLGEDDQADPRQGTLVAQKFVDAKVNGVVGHLNSGTTVPASRIYAKAGVPEISPSATTPEYTRQGFKTAFRVMANDVQQGRVLGEYAAVQLKARTVAVVDDKTAYGEGLASQFKLAAMARGVQVVDEEHTDDKAMDFAAILTTIKGKQPDLIFFGGMDPQAAPMAMQMKNLGVSAKLLMGDGGCTADFLKKAGPAAEGHYCSLPGVPVDRMAGGPAFRERFVKRFGLPIQLYAPYAYDAMMVMAGAMQRAGSAEPTKYLPELAKTDYQGVSAHIRFDANGDLTDGAITLYQAQGGQWSPLNTVGGATAVEKK